MIARAFGLFFGMGLMTICVGCFFYLVAKYQWRAVAVSLAVLVAFLALAQALASQGG